MTSITRTSASPAPSVTTPSAQSIEDPHLSKIEKIFKLFKDTKDLPKMINYDFPMQWDRIQTVSRGPWRPSLDVSQEIICVIEKNKSASES